VPADTIRGMRIFHRLSREGLATLFQVSPRTVYRWEEKGAVPNALPLEELAKVDREWRRKLLIWMVERYEAAAVTDNRKKEGD
jgi:transcriptional regulator with XRE-family HTH domain